MEKVSVKDVEYVLKELERLKVEIQRLEAMLIPAQKDPDISEEEIIELIELAKDDNPKSWIDADELPKPED